MNDKRERMENSSTGGGEGGGTKRKMDVRMLYIVEIFPTRGKFYRVVNEIFSRRYDI